MEQLRRKKFTGPICVLTQNEREDKLIFEGGATPISILAVQIGQKLANFSLEEK